MRLARANASHVWIGRWGLRKRSRTRTALRPPHIAHHGGGRNFYQVAAVDQAGKEAGGFEDLGEGGGEELPWRNGAALRGAEWGAENLP